MVEGKELYGLSLKFFTSSFFLKSEGSTTSLFIKLPVASTMKFDAKVNSTSNVPKFP